MIKKFKIFEQNDIDPYGEEVWEESNMAQLLRNIDNWL